jgi:type I restriction enzyme, S subunit
VINYPAYQDSGVEWIHEIPSHWQVRPFFAVVDPVKSKNTALAEQNLLSLSYGRIVRKDIETNAGLLPESFDTYQIIAKNDIVFRFTDLQNDKRSLRSGLVEQRGIITSAYLAVTPRINPKYLAYLSRAYDLQKVFYAMGGGLRQSMKFDDVRRLPVICPPADEQSQIAGYLDRETGKIDELIAKQLQLIEELSARRSAYIESRLHPSTEWARLKLAWGFEFLNGDRGVNYPSPEEITSSGIPFINAGDLKEGHLQTDHLKYVTEEKYAAMGGAKVQSGDILYCLRGSLGKNAHIIQIDHGSLASSLVAIRNRNPRKASTRFVFWLLNSSHERIQRELATSGSAQPNLSAESVAQMSFSVPPLLELQVQIAREIDEYVRRHITLVTTATRTIELLRERRAALISAAVTGKIDVRGL